MTLASALVVLREALSEERRRAGRLTEVSETAFLPAALEVVERPVSPTARLTAQLMLGGMVVLLLWLVFGRVDIVATAPGRIVPAGNVKLVQPASAGIVRRILVADGQHVRRGQLLVLLDSTASNASREQVRQALVTAAFDAARARAVIGALDGRGFHFQPPADSDPVLARTQAALARARLEQVRAGLSAGSSSSRAAAEQVAEARGQAVKLAETIPLLREQLDANERLLAKGYVSKLRVIEMRRQYLAAIRDREIAVRTASGAAARSASASAGASHDAAEARTELLAELAKAEADIALRTEELVKSSQRAGLDQLRAPVDGVVSQLAIHTEGGVVAAGTPVMAIVPRGGALVAEVSLPNRDVGFVAAGEPAALKLEAFPFTRYGVVKGLVRTISGDAQIDQRMGPVYLVRIAIPDPGIDIGGRRARLIPGMTVTADIRTGRRSLLSYLLSPIEAARLEAARER